jgi:hypothetical protein
MCSAVYPKWSEVSGVQVGKLTDEELLHITSVVDASSEGVAGADVVDADKHGLSISAA